MSKQSPATNDSMEGMPGPRESAVLEFAMVDELSERDDDFLSEWDASEESDSDASDLYSNLLRPHQQDHSPDILISTDLDWEDDSDPSDDHPGPVSETSPVAKLVLPKINELIYGFRLLHELGSGTFAKVFLAKQGDLADRQVVLKISAIEGTEPQTLAQLQHTHVVPIYSVHEDIRFGLRAVCMPYFGGASLNKVLQKAWSERAEPADGKDLIKALDQVSGPKPASLSPRQSNSALSQGMVHVEAARTSRDTLAELDYVHASAWIIARLAEGLQHSHERHVIHRDIKPSNILLSSEGQPLLLDFNVSQITDDAPTEASVAGTIPYMAPEQLRFLLECTPESFELVTHRSDIYSLGLVLYEMLTGSNPFADSNACSSDRTLLEKCVKQRESTLLSLRSRCQMDIPWSLESIFRKSLAPNPAERYASAGQLADDLNRFLQDLPLKFAPELSRVERMQKWGRRHPRMTTAITALFVATAFFIPGAIVLQLTRGDLATQRTKATQAAIERHGRRFNEDAKNALCLINVVVPNEETLTEGITRARATLDSYSIIKSANWQDAAEWQGLDANERKLAAERARELLMVLASTHVRIKPDDPVPAGLAALSLLQIAERVRELPPLRALELDRARYLSMVNRNDEAQRALKKANNIPLSTAYDYYMLATSHARHRTTLDYREAVRLLTLSIEMSPEHYWSHFERALCHQELGEPLLAISDLGTCIGLWPESSWAHFNRGYLLYQQGHKREAIDDYTTTIRYSPNFRSAYFNRALAHLESRNYQDALVDFKKAKELGSENAILIAGLAMSHEGMAQYDESDRLFARARELSKKSPNTATHRLNSAYAFAVAHRAPKIAMQVFEDILEVDPKHSQALYGKGMLQMERQDLSRAVRSFDEALNAKTTFIEPLRYRAVALARLGQLQQAAADANACIEREPRNPDSLYAAACVAALSAKKLRLPDLFDSALQLLQSAIEHGVDPERARNDPDFSALRGDPDFEKLLGPEPTASESAESDSH